MYAENLTKLGDLEDSSFIFNPNQRKLLDKYFYSRSTYYDGATIKKKTATLTKLNNFFESLVPIQRKIVQNWFNYQLLCIDYKILVCTKIAEYAVKNNIEKNIDFKRKESQQSLNPLRGYSSINQQIKERLEGISP